MKVEQIYTGCLAQGAYYIESDGEAVIIDPLRETAPYMEKLKREGVKLKYIFETHFHADFVSGHVDLAKKTGATIVYGPTAKTEYDIYEAKDEEEFQLGKVTFKVLHTPGHTPESTTFLLKDEKNQDYALFTGDTLFIGDVGRPDLAQKSGTITKEDLAGWLFDSLRNKIMPLANEIMVYPAHGAGSACGKNMSKETWSTLGVQKQTNYALRADMTKEEFIKEVTDGLASPPAYFAQNVQLNKMGYGSFDKVLEKGVVPLNPERLEEIVNTENALVLDTRKPEDFSNNHIPNAIFVGIDGGFAPWVGALVPDLKQAIVIIAPEGREEEVVTRLARVGYDNTLGFLKGGMDAWKAAGKELESITSISAITFAQAYKNTKKIDVLDVRKPTEYLAEHVVNAKNFPLDFINENMNKISKKESYHLHCAGGYRSMIAASILKARGFEDIINVTGGFAEIIKTDVAKTDYVCPTTLSVDEIENTVL